MPKGLREDGDPPEPIAVRISNHPSYLLHIMSDLTDRLTMSKSDYETNFNNNTDNNLESEKTSIPTAAAQADATVEASQSPLTDPANENENMSEINSSDTEHTTVYTVTEIWLPIPPEYSEKDNSVGVQILGVFWDLDEANNYAERHVKKLEDLTQAPREIEDWRELEYGFITMDHDEDDPFSGRWQRTEPVQEYDDGTKRFAVLWGNRSTTIDVEKKSVHENVGTAPSREPLHYSTVANFITRPSFARWSDDHSLL